MLGQPYISVKVYSNSRMPLVIGFSKQEIAKEVRKEWYQTNQTNKKSSRRHYVNSHYPYNWSTFKPVSSMWHKALQIDILGKCGNISWGIFLTEWQEIKQNTEILTIYSTINQINIIDTDRTFCTNTKKNAYSWQDSTEPSPN